MSTQTRPGSRELTALARAALTDVTFIQVAREARVDGHRLTLLDLAPTTIWLLARPTERVGHMATGTFLDLWWDPASRLGSAALMADLGQADPEASTVDPCIFRVSAPRISGSGLRFDLEVLSGALPPHSGACVLFVGPGGHPGTVRSRWSGARTGELEGTAEGGR